MWIRFDFAKPANRVFCDDERCIDYFSFLGLRETAYIPRKIESAAIFQTRLLTESIFMPVIWQNLLTPATHAIYFSAGACCLQKIARLANRMKVYHVVYEPAAKSVDIHFWSKCTLACRACYLRYETLDFGLFDDPIARVARKNPEKPPTKFLNLDEVLALFEGREVRSAIFLVTEAALDAAMPALAKALHNRLHSYNVLLTNGLKLADMAHVDEIIFSIKAITPQIHKAYTGKDNREILNNFESLANSGPKLPQ